MYGVYTYVGIEYLNVFVEDVDQCHWTTLTYMLRNVMNEYWRVVSIIFLGVGG